jgi:hypothetical protein
MRNASEVLSNQAECDVDWVLVWVPSLFTARSASGRNHQPGNHHRGAEGTLDRTSSPAVFIGIGHCRIRDILSHNNSSRKVPMTRRG